MASMSQVEDELDSELGESDDFGTPTALTPPDDAVAMVGLMRREASDVAALLVNPADSPVTRQATRRPLMPPSSHRCPKCNQSHLTPAVLAKHLRVQENRCMLSATQADEVSASLATCRYCHMYWTRGGLNKHEKSCKKRHEAENGVVAPVLFAQPNGAVPAPSTGDIPDDQLAWLDSMQYDDMMYFAQSLTPNSSTKDYWSFVLELVCKLMGTRFETGVKLFTMAASMIFCPEPLEMSLL